MREYSPVGGVHVHVAACMGPRTSPHSMAMGRSNGSMGKDGDNSITIAGGKL